jgi:hypothetical protein
MTQYSIFTADDNIDICLGYDDGFHGYWIFIQDHSQSTDEKEFYLFHNIDDVPGVRMSLTLVEVTLAKFGIGLPRELAEALIADGEADNYISNAREDGYNGEVSEHEEFLHRIRPKSWAPLAPLANSWS